MRKSVEVLLDPEDTIGYNTGFDAVGMFPQLVENAQRAEEQVMKAIIVCADHVGVRFTPEQKAKIQSDARVGGVQWDHPWRSWQLSDTPDELKKLEDVSHAIFVRVENVYPNGAEWLAEKWIVPVDLSPLRVEEDLYYMFANLSALIDAIDSVKNFDGSDHNFGRLVRNMAQVAVQHTVLKSVVEAFGINLPLPKTLE